MNWWTRKIKVLQSFASLIDHIFSSFERQLFTRNTGLDNILRKWLSEKKKSLSICVESGMTYIVLYFILFWKRVESTNICIWLYKSKIYLYFILYFRYKSRIFCLFCFLATVSFYILCFPAVNIFFIKLTVGVLKCKNLDKHILFKFVLHRLFIPPLTNFSFS